MVQQRLIQLPHRELPREWYNLQADVSLNPPLGPDGQPVTADKLAPVFPMNLIEQEVSTQRWIPIPEPVLDVLSLWRPTPLLRAFNFERALGTPARIYVKLESVSPPGSHKPNTAVPQAYYNREFGIKRLTTETGAGQWGSALSFACAQFELECKVYMVRVSYEQKPYRKAMIEAWGGHCVPSPSRETNAGRAVLEREPDSPGSLGIAISEAIEAAVSDASGETRYSLGSVLNHVLLHQSIIGLEVKKQLRLANETPDVIIACAGGGSNFGGISFPFVADKMEGKELSIIPVEPEACPTMTRGGFVYDFGDTAKYTPMLPMHSLGHDFVPPPIHAGGLRYHGMSPAVSQLVVQGLIAPKAVAQLEAFEAGVLFARTEGFIPAPETTNALAAVVQEARQAKEEGREKVIVVNFSGHGLLDLAGYERYLGGELENLQFDDHQVERFKKAVKDLPRPTVMK